MPPKPNPRYYSLGRRIAALPVELQLQILNDMPLSRMLELAAVAPATVPAILAHKPWTAFFTTMRPTVPATDPWDLDENPGDGVYLAKVKKERREAKQKEWDEYNNFVPRNLLPEVLEIFPTLLEAMRVATRKRPPHVLNKILEAMDTGRGSNTLVSDEKSVWRSMYWGFTDVMNPRPKYPENGIITDEYRAAKKRHEEAEPVANTSIAPTRQLAEKVLTYMHCELRFYLSLGYEHFLPLLQLYTDETLPEKLRDEEQSLDANLPKLYNTLREAEKGLNEEKAEHLLELAELVGKYPGWLIPLNRPHKPPFPPSPSSEAHVVKNYRRWAALLRDTTRSHMLEGNTIADHIFGCDRHPLLPHDLLLQVTRHPFLPVRPTAPYDPYENIYPRNPLLTCSSPAEPPIRTLFTPYSPLPRPGEKLRQDTPHFHPPTHTPANLSPFRHTYGKHIHARPVRFNLEWFRSRKYREQQAPKGKLVRAPVGVHRWGSGGRLCGTVMGIEETERTWLDGFLEVCAAVKGWRSEVVWEGDITVKEWWENNVETGIREGKGMWEEAVPPTSTPSHIINA
ncbi:hypothetical protein C8A00DRAFT_37116 [Chaetomidium leptoderma]|uniref:F-box domain-containing protein n=1 Tax=Chaetomidium leptoderma TaxID=669021 RepID=A0AAN6ZTF4_9PEZI|nr:hypothetical protein C8A00DRAFT_37116 [Chaetomidium leptoderma]